MIKNLDFDDIIVSILETQGLAIVVFISIRVAPSIRVHEVGAMPNGLIVIELILIFLYSVSEHHSEKYPAPHIESI